jgi:hypothetical protein
MFTLLSKNCLSPSDLRPPSKEHLRGIQLWLPAGTDTAVCNSRLTSCSGSSRSGRWLPRRRTEALPPLMAQLAGSQAGHRAPGWASGV